MVLGRGQRLGVPFEVLVRDELPADLPHLLRPSTPPRLAKRIGEYSFLLRTLLQALAPANSPAAPNIRISGRISTTNLALLPAPGPAWLAEFAPALARALGGPRLLLGLGGLSPALRQHHLLLLTKAVQRCSRAEPPTTLGGRLQKGLELSTPQN